MVPPVPPGMNTEQSIVLEHCQTYSPFHLQIKDCQVLEVLNARLRVDPGVEQQRSKEVPNRIQPQPQMEQVPSYMGRWRRSKLLFSTNRTMTIPLRDTSLDNHPIISSESIPKLESVDHIISMLAIWLSHQIEWFYHLPLMWLSLATTIAIICGSLSLWAPLRSFFLSSPQQLRKVIGELYSGKPGDLERSGHFLKAT